MGGLSIWHWLIVLVIVLLIFGTSRLKNVGGDLGKAIREFKHSMSGDEEKKADATMNSEPPAAPPSSPPPSGTQDPRDRVE